MNSVNRGTTFDICTCFPDPILKANTHTGTKRTACIISQNVCYLKAALLTSGWMGGRGDSSDLVFCIPAIPIYR